MKRYEFFKMILCGFVMMIFLPVKAGQVYRITYPSDKTTLCSQFLISALERGEAAAGLPSKKASILF